MRQVGPPTQFWCHCCILVDTHNSKGSSTSLQTVILWEPSPQGLLSTKQQQVKTHGNDCQRLSELQSARTEGHALPFDYSLVFPSCSSSHMTSKDHFNSLLAVFVYLSVTFHTMFGYKLSRRKLKFSGISDCENNFSALKVHGKQFNVHKIRALFPVAKIQ